MSNDRDVQRDKRINELLAKGIREEHLTRQDILEVFHDEDEHAGRVEALIAVLNEMGIPVVDTDEEVDDLLAGDRGGKKAEIELGPISDPVRMYLREIGRVSLLTAEEERQLARAIRMGMDAEEQLKEEGEDLSAHERRTFELKKLRGNIAQRRLAEANLRLVVSVAKRYLGRGL